MIKADLRTYLLSKASITTLVGQRIYPSFFPEGEYRDRIVIQETGGERTRSLSGANEQTQTSFSLDCYSDSQDDAMVIAAALHNVLECYQGLMASTTVQGVFCEPPTDSLIPLNDASEEAIHVVSVPVVLWYEEPVPTYV